MIMEKEIKNLVELAKEVTTWAVKIGMPNGWHYLDGYGNDFDVYIADNGSTLSARFNNIEIHLYSNEISFKYAVTAQYIAAAYEYASAFFEQLKSEKEAELKKKFESEKNDRINTLEKELNYLKNN